MKRTPIKREKNNGGGSGDGFLCSREKVGAFFVSSAIGG